MRNWVKIKCANRYDIDKNLHCQYFVPDFLAKSYQDMIIVLPYDFCSISQMVASVVLSQDYTGTECEVCIFKPFIQCDQKYFFAYVSQNYEVLGISNWFECFHGYRGSCECNSIEISISKLNLFQNHSPSTSIPSFISTLMSLRSTSICMNCKVPSNYPVIMKYLIDNIEVLSSFKAKFNKEYFRQVKKLKNISTLEKHLNVKLRVVKYEINKCQQFVDDLMLNLLTNNICTFKVGDCQYSARIIEYTKKVSLSHERFMNSIIKSQEQVIEHLTNKVKEVEIMTKLANLLMPS
ncbi:uncharacterized protein LOC126899365 [Daktulosphaira vitifoliae]|uniref:uncharacterized protein LOC126899365 n=1 Tax=Daktulosphaira vitifoliae TaxID=58002 RepID=UPI0021A9DBC3|nr:uncharacterized protein LOC126899365 [Daktulosphaira vitifoliae]